MDAHVALLKALGHPLRLRIVNRLAHRGPAPVSRLAAELGASLPELSTGLRVLREAGVVAVKRSGRQAVYSLSDGVDRLLPLLDRIAGARPAPVRARGGESRTCYDHLAGRVGVALARGLERRGVIAARDGDYALGESAEPELAALGIDLERLSAQRRPLVRGCLDWSERELHVAGAVGAALTTRLFELGCIVRRDTTRSVEVTAAGSELLAELGVS